MQSKCPVNKPCLHNSFPIDVFTLLFLLACVPNVFCYVTRKLHMSVCLWLIPHCGFSLIQYPDCSLTSSQIHIKIISLRGRLELPAVWCGASGYWYDPEFPPAALKFCPQIFWMWNHSIKSSFQPNRSSRSQSLPITTHRTSQPVFSPIHLSPNCSGERRGWAGGGV